MGFFSEYLSSCSLFSVFPEVHAKDVTSEDELKSDAAEGKKEKEEKEEKGEEAPKKKAVKSKDEIIAALEAQLGEARDKLQNEVVEVQQRLQKDIAELEKENQYLRAKYLELKKNGGGSGVVGDGRDGDGSSGSGRNLIEMYSDVLDTLSTMNSSYNVQDKLPRVVVVGDQSAGKTSVLEMLAQARIFPRGAGEMMTRAPVQVTLSEASVKKAYFKDSVEKVYDLDSESDLKKLRNEIEQRMKRSCSGGTVSAETISLYVKGPGLPRMVMVDLPGIISHVTAGMSRSTKDDIRNMCRSHIDNPNAIILCIQDGSVDAERSNVADIITEVDPEGKRTIFVLTKIDLAEKLNTSAKKVKDILDGNIFRMNALGYFAVVTGTGKKDESIEDIKKYEEEYFKNSELFLSGALKASQTTTYNLSRAVSVEFWKKVRTSVEREAELIKVDLNNKEIEWKNNFKGRIMSREEVFQLGKHEMLEKIANFGRTTATEWEARLKSEIWNKVENRVLDQIYFNSAFRYVGNSSDFKTTIDVELQDWAKKGLPTDCLEISKQCLQEAVLKAVNDKNICKSYFPEGQREIFGKLCDYISSKVNDRLEMQWKSSYTAGSNLGTLQRNTFEDEEITSTREWNDASYFMIDKLKGFKRHIDDDKREKFGPGWLSSYWNWTSITEENRINWIIYQELQNVIKGRNILAGEKSPSNITGGANLSYEDIATVRNNTRKQIKVPASYGDGSEGEEGESSDPLSDANIKRIYYEVVFRELFIQKSIEAANFCMYKYKDFKDHSDDESLLAAPNGLQCKDIVLFWRVQEMLQVSSKTLRQQLMNHKVRIEREVKSELDSLSRNELQKRALVTGKRVDLAEQIEITRSIYSKLDDFIQALLR
eukprot:Nk52_evm10s294 gene=Nk52_evmTU10s294